MEPKKNKCPLCGEKFIPVEGQIKAQWAINWHSMKSGLLCPSCHKAAKKLKAVSEKKLMMCQVPWGSEILLEAKNPKTKKKEEKSLFETKRKSDDLPFIVRIKFEDEREVRSCLVWAKTKAVAEDIAKTLFLKFELALVSGREIGDYKNVITEL